MFYCTISKEYFNKTTDQCINFVSFTFFADGESFIRNYLHFEFLLVNSIKESPNGLRLIMEKGLKIEFGRILIK